MFIFVVLGIIARVHGFSIFRFVRYLRDELLIVLGTSSSESVLPRMLAKMESAGCAKPVVGLVIPTGYSFNLDGTSIYLTMAAVFIAQATNTPMTLLDQLTLLAVLLLTSKGAAGVTGSGFIRLGGDAVRPWYIAGDRRSPHPWHRPVHVGGARADEPGRQRRRDRRRREMVRSAGRAAPAAGAQEITSPSSRSRTMTASDPYEPGHSIRTGHDGRATRPVAGLAHEIWYEYYVPLIGRAQVDYMVSRFQSSEAMAQQIARGLRVLPDQRAAQSGTGHRLLRGAAPAGRKAACFSANCICYATPAVREPAGSAWSSLSSLPAAAV